MGRDAGAVERFDDIGLEHNAAATAVELVR
jgi:hypothetical protein